ncbi:uncharacterized protein PHACADRAFT_193966 [Phanerochaete carnosa HHB-10118-sp]|uniref:Uncharacterized protein n=1 Tax=Phanerochaete carnosa (strain HHB-10118-sp) TaxID=650164 RepID=K5WBL1_PHACS|nr:uncharacterized protein PHACADRAFT_193966 [Phanerochaete carnosa HHB-10118-sp]EKM56349.1 hypothetical protein PHACADRAFT_193966 [Phanerochaete carnosa HHB-10118-sp]
MTIAPATANCLIQDCKPLQVLSWAFPVIQLLQTALFSALRVLAIWDKSYFWSLLTFVLSMVPFATNIYIAAVSKYSFDVDPFFGTICIEVSQISARTFNIRMFRVTYTTCGSLILADAIVLVLTWIKTFEQWRNARCLKMRASLTTCLLRDGTTYFIALLALNIAQLLTYNVSYTEIAIVSAMVTALPPVLLSRFIINLRTAGSIVSDYSMHLSDQQQGQSSLQFRRPTDRLGRVGGTLQDGWGDDLRAEESGVAEVAEEGSHEANAEA